jgi:microcin C transport system permease protein
MFLPWSATWWARSPPDTILTKNSLMENLGQDYVRTAFAKGLTERRVIFVHALRNSLIPIVTGLGHVISLILAGSFLIERVFNIDGMGYLGYTAIPAARLPVASRHRRHQQPADARRQHPVGHRLRGGRSAHPVQMTDPVRPVSVCRPMRPSPQRRSPTTLPYRRRSFPVPGGHLTPRTAPSHRDRCFDDGCGSSGGFAAAITRSADRVRVLLSFLPAAARQQHRAGREVQGRYYLPLASYHAAPSSARTPSASRTTGRSSSSSPRRTRATGC